MNDTKKTLQLIAKIFMVLGTAVQAIFLLPLVWCIPMTIYYFKKVDAGEEVGLVFKVCALLFVNLVAGVLMLLENEKI